MKRIYQAVIITALLLMISTSAWANTCQYHTAGNWSTAGTWQNCGGVAPTSTDTCEIGTDLTTGTLTVDGTSGSPNVCGTTNFTGFTGTLSMGSGKELDMYGGLTIVSGMTFTPNVASILKFKGTSGPYTIKSGGKNMPPTTFDGVGGSWVHGDAWTEATATPNYTITNGSVDTGNFNLSSLNFSSSNSNTRSFTLGSSTITLSTTWDITNSSGMTLSAGSSTITNQITSQAGTFNGGGLTYGTVQNAAITTGSVTITGANTFGTLTLSQGNSVGDLDYGYILGANQTVSGTCTFNGFSVLFRDWIRSDTRGTARTISCGAVSSLDANFQDITGAGAGSWDVSSTTTGRGGDLGGNSGITFASPKTCWFTNGGSSQNITALVWKTTDGGGVACTTDFPLPHDIGAFGTAWTGSAKVLTMNVAASWAPKLDFSTVANSPTITFTGNYLYTRDIVLRSTMTVNGTAQITFEGSGTRNIDITTAGLTLTSKILHQGGPNLTVRQLDNLTTDRNTTNCIDITSGIYRNNTFTTNCTGAAGTITISGGTFKYSGNLTSASGVAVYLLTSGAFTPDTGYYQTNMVLNQVTVAAIPSSGGSCSWSDAGQFKNIEAVNDNKPKRPARKSKRRSA